MESSLGAPIYQAGTTTGRAIYDGKCVLLRIIVGADVASSDIEIGDSKTVSTENTRFKLTGSTLKGTYEMRATFMNGIYATQVNQTKVTYVVAPLN